MSDTTDNTPDQDDSEGIKNLRAKAAKAEAAEARAEAAERRAAFLEAGVPLSSKPAQALMSSYSGEMTPEAIKAEAKEWGLLNDTDAGDDAPKYDQTSDERKFQDQRGALDEPKIADPDDKPKKGGVDSALEGFKTARESGVGVVPAMNDAYGALIKAAAQGDAQAIFNPNEWERTREQHGHGAEFAR